MTRFALFSVLLMTLTACATGETAPLRPVSGYQLLSGDQLKVSVYGEDELTGTYLIDGQGEIAFPLIGSFAVTGKTSAEIKQELEAALADGYLVEPRVLVEIANPRPIYILGEVSRPGEYPYSEAITVLQAIAKAGGYTYRANRSTVYIAHTGANEEVKYKLTPTTVALPGDTIRVGERFF